MADDQELEMGERGRGGCGPRSKSTALKYKIRVALKKKREPRQKGLLAILELSALAAGVKGNHQYSRHGESHFSAQM